MVGDHCGSYIGIVCVSSVCSLASCESPNLCFTTEQITEVDLFLLDLDRTYGVARKNCLCNLIIVLEAVSDKLSASFVKERTAKCTLTKISLTLRQWAIENVFS